MPSTLPVKQTFTPMQDASKDSFLSRLGMKSLWCINPFRSQRPRQWTQLVMQIRIIHDLLIITSVASYVNYFSFSKESEKKDNTDEVDHRKENAADITNAFYDLVTDCIFHLF
jgi:hypothetical protein